MRRAVITGLGAVTPVGNDVPSTWDSLVSGRSGIEFISRFDADEYPVNIAAEVKDFDPTGAMAAREVRKTGLDVQYGVAAAMEAWEDSGMGENDPSRVGVMIGSAVGGLPQVLEQHRVLQERGRERVSPHWLPNMLVDTTTSHVATQLGIRGVNYAVVSACASGTVAIGEAAEVIRRDAGRRDPGRRHRVGDRAADPGRVLRHAGAGRRPRRPGRRVAPVRRHPRRLRDGRGRGGGDGRGARARAGARCARSTARCSATARPTTPTTSPPPTPSRAA